ncbi:nucleoside phosphorylase [Ruminococcus sp.]|uniref:nucleoside phosphorylase n=1 Tax=Ruminococcus sp. TaxID=41978 RepID=UPI0025D2FDDC|nr:nucleoside phosphorylase [Ruminococcus sp.]MBQ8967681.1 nucleoside phosphorylase [Ruminococcus sp.]
MASILDGERQFHIQTLPSEIGKYVILPGDPGRVPKIAALLDNAEQVAYNREYNTYTGYLDGEKVSVCSTGIGGPSTAIAVEELVKCGANTFIRVGTCGGMHLKVWGGDLIIAGSAIRCEGTSRDYLPEGYPAAADYTIVRALADTAGELSENEHGKRYHVGVVHSKDSFYGQVEPERSGVASYLLPRWESFEKCGCLASEMECAALFAVGQVLDVRCGAVLTAIWNMQRSQLELPDTMTNDSSRAIKCAVEAIRKLIRQDKQKH